jgi:hypothetical protein
MMMSLFAVGALIAFSPCVRNSKISDGGMHPLPNGRAEPSLRSLCDNQGLTGSYNAGEEASE